MLLSGTLGVTTQPFEPSRGEKPRVVRLLTSTTRSDKQGERVPPCQITPLTAKVQQDLCQLPPEEQQAPAHPSLLYSSLSPDQPQEYWAWHRLSFHGLKAGSKQPTSCHSVLGYSFPEGWIDWSLCWDHLGKDLNDSGTGPYEPWVEQWTPDNPISRKGIGAQAAEIVTCVSQMCVSVSYRASAIGIIFHYIPIFPVPVCWLLLKTFPQLLPGPGHLSCFPAFLPLLLVLPVFFVFSCRRRKSRVLGSLDSFSKETSLESLLWDTKRGSCFILDAKDTCQTPVQVAIASCPSALLVFVACRTAEAKPQFRGRER